MTEEARLEFSINDTKGLYNSRYCFSNTLNSETPFAGYGKIAPKN